MKRCLVFFLALSSAVSAQQSSEMISEQDNASNQSLASLINNPIPKIHGKNLVKNWMDSIRTSLNSNRSIFDNEAAVQAIEGLGPKSALNEFQKSIDGIAGYLKPFFDTNSITIRSLLTMGDDNNEASIYFPAQSSFNPDQSDKWSIATGHGIFAENDPLLFIGYNFQGNGSRINSTKAAVGLGFEALYQPTDITSRRSELYSFFSNEDGTKYRRPWMIEAFHGNTWRTELIQKITQATWYHPTSNDPVLALNTETNRLTLGNSTTPFKLYTFSADGQRVLNMMEPVIARHAVRFLGGTADIAYSDIYQFGAALRTAFPVFVNNYMNTGSPRPAFSNGYIGGELSGYGNTIGEEYGFLRLSAGGHTNKTAIDLAGPNNVNADMNSNVVIYTNGTERVRVDNDGLVIAGLADGWLKSENGVIKSVASSEPPMTMRQSSAIVNEQQFDDPVLMAYAKLGAPITAETIGLNPQTAIATSTLKDGEVSIIAVPAKAGTYTGVIIHLSKPGVYIGDKANRVGLHTYSNGTLSAPVASSANNPLLWANANDSYVIIPFQAPYTLVSDDVLYVSLVFNASGTPATAPVLYAGSVLPGSGHSAASIFTNSAKLFGTIASQNDIPNSPTSMTSIATSVERIWVGLMSQAQKNSLITELKQQPSDVYAKRLSE
jgi:hypothetical protein